MKKKVRARNRRGQYLGDDPKTARNEAYKLAPGSILDGYKDTLKKFGGLWI
jgi:hypothetical protein